MISYPDETSLQVEAFLDSLVDSAVFEVVRLPQNVSMDDYLAAKDLISQVDAFNDGAAQ